MWRHAAVVELYQRFGEKQCLHLQGYRVSWASNKHTEGTYPSVCVCCHLLGKHFDAEVGGSKFLLNVGRDPSEYILFSHCFQYLISFINLNGGMVLNRDT